MAGVPATHERENHPTDEMPMAYRVGDEIRTFSFNSDQSNKPLFDNTHRKLKPRHIQLIGIGGYVDSKLNHRGGPMLRTAPVA